MRCPQIALSYGAGPLRPLENLLELVVTVQHFIQAHVLFHGNRDSVFCFVVVLNAPSTCVSWAFSMAIHHTRRLLAVSKECGRPMTRTRLFGRSKALPRPVPSLPVLLLPLLRRRPSGKGQWPKAVALTQTTEIETTQNNGTMLLFSFFSILRGGSSSTGAGHTMHHQKPIARQ